MIYFRPVAVPPPANLGSRPSFCSPESLLCSLSFPPRRSRAVSKTSAHPLHEKWTEMCGRKPTCIGLTNVGNDAVCQRNSCRSKPKRRRVARILSFYSTRTTPTSKFIHTPFIEVFKRSSKYSIAACKTSTSHTQEVALRPNVAARLTDDVTHPAKPPFCWGDASATRRSRRKGHPQSRKSTTRKRLFDRYFAVEQASAALHRRHAQRAQGLHPPRRAAGAVWHHIRVSS